MRGKGTKIKKKFRQHCYDNSFLRVILGSESDSLLKWKAIRKDLLQLFHK